MSIQQNTNHFDISYNTLRQCMGVLAIAMPVLLWSATLRHGNCNEILSSISSYHHTHAGHIFTAISVLMAVVFYIYRGYDNDYIFMRIAAVLALGVAFVPNEQAIDIASCVLDDTTKETWTAIPEGCFITTNKNCTLAYIHLACAVGFFAMLSYISICRFTKSCISKEELGSAKRRRNRIYVVCGVTMIVTMILILIYFIGRETYLSGLVQYDPIFWGEWIMIWAFGIAWLTKGQIWAKD